jgi:CMP-N-acetylneuraminic acid synthetase
MAIKMFKSSRPRNHLMSAGSCKDEISDQVLNSWQKVKDCYNDNGCCRQARQGLPHVLNEAWTMEMHVFHQGRSSDHVGSCCEA